MPLMWRCNLCMQLILTDFRNIQLRLKEPFDDNLKRLNEDMEKLFPTRDIVFSSFQKVIDDQNSTVTDFRNAALLAAITILLLR